MPHPAARRLWPAPAKLNLMLRVLGRRADGYHRLQTVFQFLDHADQIRIEPRSDGAVHRRTALPGVPEEADLVVRAARCLQQATGCRQGVDLWVDKHLPMGGGVGGGSSDAATVLVALNQLWDTGLSPAELAHLGLTLGADVPVFVHGRAAWAEGVGEALTPIELPEPWYLVLVPRCAVATAAVFSDPDLTRDSAPITIADFLAGDDRNDCLAVVERDYPEVAAALRWLSGFGRARLTGTGACVFAAFADEGAARAARCQLPAPFGGFVARGRNRSPLIDEV
jgi:4-diphosphocytidyl-2-C-methyl-D-erythritol kinase